MVWLTAAISTAKEMGSWWSLWLVLSSWEPCGKEQREAGLFHKSKTTAEKTNAPSDRGGSEWVHKVGLGMTSLTVQTKESKAGSGGLSSLGKY